MRKKKNTVQLQEISFILNGKNVSCEIKPSAILLDVIRDVFELKGTKPGCNEGECGACTVLVNDASVNSCLFLAVNANGKEVTTIEGLTKEDGALDIVQKSLVESGAVQCGFCTPGMVMNILAMQKKYKSEKKRPSRDEIKKWMEGNLCRCTGYVKIAEAVEKLFSE